MNSGHLSCWGRVNMCAPTLSVIIPVYNEGRYIKECIDSIITNGSVHFEIVVSDNCSTDDTLQKLDEYRDVRLKVHRFNESVSPHVNLFNCINKSQGKYIYFIGGDDYFVPGVLDEVIPLLNGSSVVAPFVTFDDKTNSEIAVRNNKDEFDLFFSNCDSFLNKILCNVNHDTLFHSFILRDDLLGCEKIMRSSMESLQIWLLLFIFNGRTSVMYFPDVVFYKRYNKRDDSVGYV